MRGFFLFLFLIKSMLFVLSFVFGTLGFYYFVHGKKEGKAIYMLSGIGLMIYPYFISGLFLNIFIGTILIFLPLFL